MYPNNLSGVRQQSFMFDSGEIWCGSDGSSHFHLEQLNLKDMVVGQRDMEEA